MISEGVTCCAVILLYPDQFAVHATVVEYA
jgi:hypothetical protein